MKFWPITLLVFLLAACGSTSAIQPEQAGVVQVNPSAPSSLPDLGAAPELTNQVWLNAAQPLRLADLRGQVVLLDMWTFG